MKTIDEIRRMLAKFPKENLGFYPTPFYQLKKVSADYGVNLYVKREDFSGVSLFGGNKVRKLQYLMGDAKRLNCDTVVTYGATQSNHAMQTATAARQCGLNPVLFLEAVVEPNPEDVRANMLLDTILGAEMHLLFDHGQAFKEQAAEERKAIAAGRIKELEKAGHKVYDIPGGGSSPVGALGFIEAYLETLEQSRAMGVEPDHLFVPSGSGGTLGGLIAAKALLGNPCVVNGVLVGPKGSSYEEELFCLARDTLSLLGAEEQELSGLLTLHGGYYGEGYEIPSKEVNDAIRYLARREGLFADPVYSGKAFYGMLQCIKSGAVAPGSNVIFLHTGGTTALFSEQAIVGDLSRA